MTRAEPDNDAIARHVLRFALPPAGNDLSTILEHAGVGLRAAADTVDIAAADPVILDMMRRDPVATLRGIAATLRKAAGP